MISHLVGVLAISESLAQTRDFFCLNLSFYNSRAMLLFTAESMHTELCSQ